MASCGSLSSLFEKPMPEKPTLIESLSSWNQILPKTHLDAAHFTEIFGELHFEGKPPFSPSLSTYKPASESFLGLSANSDKLQLCTERLGSESSDDVDDLGDREGLEIKSLHEGQSMVCNSCCVLRPRRTGEFPPPIPSIGKSGKPWVYLKSYRDGGRFLLREIRIPSHEFLHASRQDGRLKLQLVHPSELGSEGYDDDEEEEEEEELEEEGEEKEEFGEDNGEY
ncbi:hypothetical protein ZIOFF_018219 [Zingiber officinale]|uniref:FAF domain-containing protein n=1 Tax=Zingiber officinale TaxID=94328 RepID=A0A8J5HG72_ZINOF|nr:hypothetical protein ZIOFF_018219 [Zingiber officinale]